MSRFEVYIHSSKEVSVTLRPYAPGAQAISLGSSQGELAPILPDLMGRHILLTVFERTFEDDECDAGDGTKAYVVAPPRPTARLLSCWMGQMAAVWPGEPMIDRLKPIASEESVARWNKPMSEALHELFRTSLVERIVLFVGTSAVLTELQRLLTDRFALMGHETRVMEAVLSLGVSRSDLGAHAPYLLTVISRVLKEHRAALGDRETDLRIAEAALETAQIAFGQAKRGHEAALTKVGQLNVLHRGWLKMNPEPVSDMEPVRG